jgi:hypothetical protein
MAEVYNFPEGTAWVWTGDSTNSAALTFATEQSITINRGSQSYREPFSNQYTYVRSGEVARGNFSQLHSQKNLKSLFAGTNPGEFHMHVSERHLSVSAGFRLWSGEIASLSWNSTPGDNSTLNIQVFFGTASAY